jgi:hypothetical protein
MLEPATLTKLAKSAKEITLQMNFQARLMPPEYNHEVIRPAYELLEQKSGDPEGRKV